MKDNLIKWLKRTTVGILIVLISGIILLPFYNMLLLSVVPENIFLQEDFLLYPKDFTLDSFIYVFGSRTLWKGACITVLVTTIGTAYNMFLTVTAAYILTQNFYGKKVYVTLLFLTMFFDGGLIANYLLIKNLKLLNSIFAMILPTGINIAYLLLLSKSFKRIPRAMIESARIDGANDIAILSQIVIPAAKPTITAIALYYAVERWNEWYLGMLYINSSDLQPLQLVLRSIVSNANSIRATELMENLGIIPFENGVKMACTIVTMVPIVLVYPFLQKHFVGGLTDGATKE